MNRVFFVDITRKSNAFRRPLRGLLAPYFFGEKSKQKRYRRVRRPAALDALRYSALLAATKLAALKQLWPSLQQSLRSSAATRLINVNSKIKIRSRAWLVLMAISFVPDSRGNFAHTRHEADAFDLDERVNRRSAQRQVERGAKLFERSEFFAPRLHRALQGTQRSWAVKLRKIFWVLFDRKKYLALARAAGGEKAFVVSFNKLNPKAAAL